MTTQPKFQSLTHARAVRDAIYGELVRSKEESEVYLERWCAAQGSWREGITDIALRASKNPYNSSDYVSEVIISCENLIETIEYIRDEESRLVHGPGALKGDLTT